jgi:hypothetical protein
MRSHSAAKRTMHNAPFRFLDSTGALALLRRALAQVGLSEQDPAGAAGLDAAPHHPACLRFTCRWLSGPVELHWLYQWWDDGMSSELARITVVYEGTVRGVIEVEELIGRRLGRPLAELLVERIAACCAELTGKRRRPAGPDPQTGEANG